MAQHRRAQNAQSAINRSTLASEFGAQQIILKKFGFNYIGVV